MENNIIPTQREEGFVYIATISGGKDSTVMCDLLLKNNFPVDYIVFNDTLDEFEEMYEYLDKVEDYFKRKYGKGILRLKPVRTYENYIFRPRSRGKNVGRIFGLPSASVGFCEWRRDAKIRPFDRWIKKIKKPYKTYIGFTTDEARRMKNTENEIYPLITHFNMSEKDCNQYLKDNDMENPLYRHFDRTGCRKCQYQSDKSFYNIWKYYPKVWQEMRDLEKTVHEYPDPIGTHWFTKHRSCDDMEILFKEREKDDTIVIDDSPLKDCFCKI